MASTLYLSLEEALYLHARLLERFGGTAGVRDMGLLESALSRPRSGYYASLSEQAAALLQSLALNHIFIDGNKRVAFAACAIFLDMNGFTLGVDAEAAERFLIDRVITEHAELATIVQWLEAHMQRR